MSFFSCSAFLQGATTQTTTTTAPATKPVPLLLTKSSFPGRSSFAFLQAENSNGCSDDSPIENSTNNSTLVTKEMFLRDILEDSPTVTVQKKGRRKGKKEYRVMDNRDSLPFAVQVTTPDPYTHPDEKKKRAAANKVKRRPDAVEQIASSLYTTAPSSSSSKQKRKDRRKEDSEPDNEADFSTKLGEFSLDKYTTTGDLLNIGDTQYKVVRHKCQYKYAGGQRFVMVRKVLQVKEVGRLRTEEYLKRQWKQSQDEESEGILES